MTLILKGKRVACDGDHCNEVFAGAWNDASAAGWLSPDGSDALHYCPACAAPIRNVIDHGATLARQETERRRDSLACAETLSGLIAEEGGPRTSVWQGSDGSVRLYFPGNAGYLSFSGRDISDRMHGKQTFEPRAMWPSWRRAYGQARKRL